MWFYLLFLFSILVMGSFLLGPFSIRVYMTVIMLLYLMFITKASAKKIDKYVVTYIIFVLLMSLSMSMNGEAAEFGLLKWVLACHFVCIVAYVATRHFAESNSGEGMRAISIFFLVILLVDSITTIAQYNNIQWGWGLNMMLTAGRNEAVADFVSDGASSLDTMIGSARTPGIFGNVVGNAMFLGALGVIPFTLLRGSKFRTKVISVISIALSVVACFMCQERAGLIALLLSIFYLIFKMTNKKYILVLALLALIPIISTVNFGAYDLGRFKDVSIRNDTRESIWNYFGMFFSENWLWGGPLKYQLLAGHLPHNFIFNAFVFGGLFGGIAVILLFTMIIVRGISNLINKYCSFRTVVFTVSLLAFLLQGFVHNASLVTGDIEIFLLLGLMVVSESIDKSKSHAK